MQMPPANRAERIDELVWLLALREVVSLDNDDLRCPRCAALARLLTGNTNGRLA